MGYNVMDNFLVDLINITFQSFRFSNVCYWSYLSRTILEIFLSIGLFLIYWCWGMPNLEREIECDVHGNKYQLLYVLFPSSHTTLISPD